MRRRIDRAPVALVLDVFSKLATLVTKVLEVFSGLPDHLGLRCANTYARDGSKILAKHVDSGCFNSPQPYCFLAFLKQPAIHEERMQGRVHIFILTRACVGTSYRMHVDSRKLKSLIGLERI
jgi:hypothetical protein